MVASTAFLTGLVNAGGAAADSCYFSNWGECEPFLEQVDGRWVRERSVCKIKCWTSGGPVVEHPEVICDLLGENIDPSDPLAKKCRWADA